MYKRYSTNLLQYVVAIEEASVQERFHSCEISATIKLLNKPLENQNADRSETIVYTAFRDKKTYDKHKREVGRDHYTIDGNTDFVHCLTKDSFIMNNMTKNAENYRNEHREFSRDYDCTIVVPIKTKHPGGKYKIYGYLCCDCLSNGKTELEIFDKTSARYLYAMAQMYASFLETLDSNWIDRVPKIGYSSTFMEVIFNNTTRS